MEHISAARAVTPSGAVFLSYASEDSEPAARIAEALKTAGIEVWFDKSELRGGDAWDQSIRRQIRECRLFIPIISVNTQARLEGYFRREWKLAVDRTQDMAGSVAFIVPVAIDATREAVAEVPEGFRQVQWTRLAGPQTPPAFIERVRRLLSSAASIAENPVSLGPLGSIKGSLRSIGRIRRRQSVVWAASCVAVALIYVIADKVWLSKTVPAASTATAAARVLAVPSNGRSTADFNPPPHSIAVLPFTNMSGDPKEEYFSDGMTEELINALSQIASLQVIARTSSFSFKGQNADIGLIGRKLNVATVLEGSVRQSGDAVRITVQLIDAASGFHRWSQNYDRALKNIIALQSEIATNVARELQARLLGDEIQRIDVGGTSVPAAHDAYLRGIQLTYKAGAPDSYGALAAFTLATELDPDYAAAHARRSWLLTRMLYDFPDASTRRGLQALSQSAAERAVAIAPEFGEAHYALGGSYLFGLDAPRAIPEFELAAKLSPGDAWVLRNVALLDTTIKRDFDAGVKTAQLAVSLDPRNRSSYENLSDVLENAHRYEEALAAARSGAEMDPYSHDARARVYGVLIAMRQYEPARSMCEAAIDSLDADDRHLCLALAYHGLGRVAEAEEHLKQWMDLDGDKAAVDYAGVYAQWGQAPQALHWLARAEAQRDPRLLSLYQWRFDPIRDTPEFKALFRRLDFPL